MKGFCFGDNLLRGKVACPLFCGERGKMKGKRAVTGFTLIETIVTATIFAFLAVGIAATFVSGIRLWQRAKDIDFSQYDTLLTFEKITKELRQSVNISSIGFAGDALRISFPTLVGNTVFKVTYRFDEQEKALIRGQVSQEDILLGKEEENYTEKKVIALDSFSLSYFFLEPENQEYIWKDSWEKTDGIFTAIKFNTELKGEEFTKTVFIPIS